MSTEEVLAWKQELKTTHPTAERGAWLHLWLGEWELAQNEQPTQAQWYFRQAQHLTNPRHRCFGLAAYDRAIALFYEGAYAEATDAFAALLQSKNARAGYDGRDCALWLRHAEACANYHVERAKLGIPEPPRLDPFCGAAALAACLHSLALPYDRATLLRTCRVTGEGSSLQDVLNAGRKLGLNARPVTADDQGLMALPKPLVAYVEQDHFVALVRADKAGVSYLCSDCGPWPGGRVNLTWAQWHALNPGVYAVVTTPGSRTDALLREALASRTTGSPVHPAARVSYAGPLSALRLKAHFPAFGSLSALRGHINQYEGFSKAATCGHKPEALHCLGFLHCPTVAPATSSCHSPVAHDPVNLATGEEEYTPEPDLVVYNPIGPSVSWSRIYNSLRDQVAYPDHNPVDYGVGWSYSYNIRIYAPNGFGEPYGYVYVVFPNGSGLQIGNNTNGIGSPSGAPFTAEGGGGAPVVLTTPDRSRWSFGQGSNADYKYLSQITDRNGHSIHFNYDASSNLGSITDDNGKTLLGIGGNQFVSDCYGRTVWYQSASFGAYSYPELTNVSQVVPTTSSPPSPLPSRYAYNYADVPSGDAAEVVPFLHTITVPSPTGSGTSTATIWYLNQPNDGVKSNPNYSTASSSGPFVSAIVDSNGNMTAITPLTGVNQSQVQVTDSNAKVLRTSRYGFDSQMRLTLMTDYNLNTVETLAYNNDPYRPSSVTDGKGLSWSFTWGNFGHLTSETPPHSGAFPRTPATTNYTYDYSYFKLGELTQIQTDGKKPLTIAYDHTKGYQQTYNGPFFLSGYIQSITTPQPGQTGINNPASVSSNFLFDGYGNLTSLTTPGNNATVVNGIDQGITTTFGYTTDGSYSQSEAIGQPLTIRDSLGHFTHFRYDSQGNTVARIDALGYETDALYYDPSNPATYGVDAQGARQSLDNQPRTVRYPATGQTGGSQSYTAYSYQYVGGPLATLTAYDESGSVLNGSRTGANAVRQVSYQYGTEGETLAVGGSTEPAQYGYDGLYRQTALADGNGHSTHYYFNPNGYLDSVTYPGYTGPVYPNISGPDSVHYPLYDGDGSPLKRIDGNGVETDYTYNDPESLLTNIHYPAGQLADVSYAYDSYGRVSSMTDGTGATNYEGTGLPGYDDLDNPLAVQTAYSGIPAQTVGYGYFNDGSRRTMTVPGRTYSYSYDAAGRFTGLANGVGESAAWAYQPNNWPLSQTDSNSLVALPTYNALGQLTDLQNQAAGGSIISEFGDPSHGHSISHDAVGNALSVTSYVPAEGYATTSHAYDSRDQLTQESSGRGGGYTNAFGYDTAGNPTALRGVSALFNADNQALTPAGNNPAFGSDGNGNPGAARGRTLTFDPENRLTGAADQAGAVPTAVSVSPDNLLHLIGNYSNGSILLANIRLSDGGTSQTFGPFGPYPDWTCTDIAAGPDDRTRVLWSRADGTVSLWSVGNDGSNPSTPYGPFPGWTCTSVAVGPDNLNHLLWTRADGTASLWTIQADGSTPFTQYGPYPGGWTCAGIAVGSDKLTRALWTCVDGSICVWTINSSGIPVSQQYGPRPGWTSISLAVGTDSKPHVLWRRTDGAAQTWVINADSTVNASPVFGPYAGYVPVNLAMDGYNVGRLLLSDSHGDSRILNILPDNASTSVLTTLTSSHLAGTGEMSAYRGDGLRGWKQNDAGARTYYLYDGGTPVCELDGGGNVIAQTMFGAWGLVSRNTPSTGTAFYAFDERGNVAQRTNSSGAVTSTDLYDGWGKKRSGPADVWGFGGQAGYYTDAETGLILCTHRFYDPQSGRFLTRDPIGYAGGINLYSYTQNNPVNWMDPSGYAGGAGGVEAGDEKSDPTGGGKGESIRDPEDDSGGMMALGIKGLFDGISEVVNAAGNAANDAIDNLEDGPSPQNIGNEAHEQPFQDYIKGQHPGTRFTFPKSNAHGPDALVDEPGGNLFDPNWDFAELKKNTPEEIARGNRALNNFSRRGYKGKGQLFTYTVTPGPPGTTTFTFGPHPPCSQGTLGL